MKLFFKLSLFCLIFSPFNCFSQESNNFYFNMQTLDINNVTATVNNLGNFEPAGHAGVTWINSKIKYFTDIVYQQGHILIGNYEDKLNMTYSGWHNLYAPGPIINGSPAMIAAPQDSTKYRIYKVTRNKLTETDYLEWPSIFGAPSMPDGGPKFYGDQMLWSVYNSYDHYVFGRFGDYTPIFSKSITPIPIEIQQLTFAKKRELSDIVFIELTIINKGDSAFNNVVYSLFADIDFWNIFTNFPAIDTTLQLGYCWGKDFEGGISPAVGYQLLYGPKVPSVGDTAFFKGRYIENYKNLGITSFHGIVDDSHIHPPGDYIKDLDKMWNAANGLESDGSPIYDPIFEKTTKFYWPGDPVTQNGWTYTDNYSSTGGGGGFYIFTGPFDIQPNDTQWVMLALYPEIGDNNLESIIKLREKAGQLLNTTYEDLIKPSSGNIDSENPVSEFFDLMQNYPNPFNTETTIKLNLPEDSFVNLEIFNALGEKIKTVINNYLESGLYTYNISMKEYSSGIYFYRFSNHNTIQTKKMILLK